MPTSFLHPSAFRRANARVSGRKPRPRLRLGNDLCAIAEVQNATTTFGLRYLNRIFTQQELADCSTAQGWRFCSLAARFAVKEATMKVLRLSPEQALAWCDIEVRRDRQGAPRLHLQGRAQTLAQQAGLSNWCLSFSHEAEYACATVLAVSNSCSRKSSHEPS